MPRRYKPLSCALPPGVDHIATMGAMRRVACFGEMLVRLAAPHGQRLCGAAQLDLAVGGAEANVAIALAHLGHASAMISVLPDNPLGELVLAELRRHAVDTAAVRLAGGRMGLYFLERGAGLRPARVLYDRQFSAFSLALREPLPWEQLLADCDWLHVSGITAALSAEGAQSVLTGVHVARARGMGVSFDCNYRPSLWQARAAEAGALAREIAEQAQLLFASEHDLALMLHGETPTTSGPESFAAAAHEALSRFARLRQVASTFRSESQTETHTLLGACVSPDGMFLSQRYALRGTVERIGSGDAFAAGMLHGTLSGSDAARTVEFATACACLKHSVATDFSVATVSEVEALLRGDVALRR